jgi:hypothetical protein
MDRSVHLKDEALRIFYTLESIERWLEICPNGKFVLCDGSGFNFTSLIAENFKNANIECLFFFNDPNLIHKHGKGYGEGEIIRYALKNSGYLRQSTWFAKCTAKLWVENFQQCVSQWNGKFLCKAYFSDVFSFKKTSMEYIDTRFYLAEQSFYMKYLSDAHLNIDIEGGQGIEEKFLEVMNLRGFKKILFRNSPVVSGVGGGSGKYYNTSIIRCVKEAIRLKLVYLNLTYRDLIN